MLAGNRAGRRAGDGALAPAGAGVLPAATLVPHSPSSPFPHPVLGPPPLEGGQGADEAMQGGASG